MPLMPRVLSKKMIAGMMGLVVLCLALYVGSKAAALPFIQPCFKCSEYLNRLSNVDCPSGDEDCGPCVPDYFLSDDGVTCYQLELIKSPPDSVTAVEGGVVSLACSFNGDAYCVWSRDDIEVAIGGRYRWTTHQDPALPRRDCGLTIDRLDKDIDAGRWDCRTQVSSTSNVVLITHQVTLQIVANTTHSNEDYESTTVGDHDESNELDPTDSGLSTVAIIGISVGVVAIIIILIAVIVYLIKCKSNNGKLTQTTAKIVNTIKNRSSRLSFPPAEER